MCISLAEHLHRSESHMISLKKAQTAKACWHVSLWSHDLIKALENNFKLPKLLPYKKKL